MKRTILKAATFCVAVGLNFTGCTQTIDGGVQIPDSSVVAKNASTKLYYEDTNNIAIKEDLKNFVEFLNKEDEMKTNFIPTDVKAPEDVKHTLIGLDRVSFKFIKNDTNKTLKLKFLVDSNSNSIIADKKYSSSNEVCSDFATVVQYIYQNAKGKTEQLDKIGASDILYLDAQAMREGKLKFTTKREVTRMLIADNTKTAFTKAGYTLVNTPAEADMSIYFQITRDYYQSELKKLKDEGKSPNFGVVSAGLTNQINKMDIGMRLANTSNSSGASVGAGLGVGLVFALLDSGTDKNIVIPSFKITKEKEGKSYLYVPSTFTNIYSNIPLGGDGKPYLSQEENGPYYNSVRVITEGREYIYNKNEIK